MELAPGENSQKAQFGELRVGRLGPADCTGVEMQAGLSLLLSSRFRIG